MKNYCSSTLCSRLLTLMIFLSCLVLTCLALEMCLQKWFRFETATADSYSHINLQPFPELTVCPALPYRLDTLREHGILNTSDIQFAARWISNNSDLSPVKFYEIILFQVEELVEEIRVDLEEPLEGKVGVIFSPADIVCNSSLYTNTEYYFNGRCFSFQMPSCIVRKGILEMKLFFSKKVDVFIHHSSQYFSPDSRTRVDVQPRKYKKIAVNHEVVRLLSDTGSCSDRVLQSFDECIQASLYRIMMEEGPGCTVPWLRNRSNICRNEDDRKMAFEIYQGNRRNQNNICANPCTFTNMYFGPPVTGDSEQYGELILYFKKSIKVTSEFQRYTALSLIAEIGGYVGLLMGYSVLGVTRVISPIMKLSASVFGFFMMQDKKIYNIKR